MSTRAQQEYLVSPQSYHYQDEALPEVVPGNSPEVCFDPNRQKAFDSAPKYPAFPDDAQKEAVSPQTPWGGTNSTTTAWGSLEAQQHHKAEHQPDNKRRICGLAPKTFWIALIVLIVIVVAAIGGGVGGGVTAAQKKQSSADAAAAAASSSAISNSQSTPTSSVGSSATPTSPSSTSTSSSATSTPTTLNNATQPFSFQGFAQDEYQGNATEIIKYMGLIDFAFNMSSYVWEPNGTDCCVAFCQKAVNAGWWCQSRHQNKASGVFDRLYIGCGKGAQNMNSTRKCTN